MKKLLILSLYLSMLSLIFACEEDDFNNTDASLIVNIDEPENKLFRGVVPISVSAVGIAATRILLNGDVIFTSSENEFVYELKTRNFPDGNYTLSVIADDSEEYRADFEIEIFNNLLTYELSEQEFNSRDQQNPWRVVVISSLDGRFLDYKIMDAPGVYEFEGPDDFDDTEFVFYFYWKLTSFRETLVSNAWDATVGKWGTSIIPENAPATNVREQEIQLEDFDSELDNSFFGLFTEQRGPLSTFSSDRRLYNVLNFPNESQVISSFITSSATNTNSLMRHQFNSNEAIEDEIYRISKSSFEIVQTSSILSLPSNNSVSYRASFLNQLSTYSNIFNFRFTGGVNQIETFDIGQWYDDYEYEIIVDQFGSPNISKRYRFRNENVPSSLPEINYGFSNINTSSDAISFQPSGDNGLITVALSDFSDFNSISRLFIIKNYDENMSIKLPTIPQSLIDFDPIFAKANSFRSYNIEIRNERELDSGLKSFLNFHGKTDNYIQAFVDVTRFYSVGDEVN